MSMKKITALLLSAILTMSTTVFAISETEIAEFEKKQADIYSDIVSDVKTESGEDLTEIINGDKVIPIYYFENNHYDQFSNYKTLQFYKEFQQEPVGYFAATTDENIVEISRLGYPEEKSIGTKLDSFPEMYRNIMFNDGYLAKLLSDVDVKDITDMRFGYFMNHGSNLLFYINTDKGEFLILGRDTSKVYNDEVLKADTLYSADKIVEWRKDSLAEALEDYKKSLENEEPYWSIDENGDDIFVAPKPKETSIPDEAPNPSASEKPTAAPKATVKPTDAPKETAVPKPSDKPAKKTLSVQGGDAIAVMVEQKPVNFPDAKPFIDDNDRTQIPVRAVADMLECTVNWDEETNTVTITNQNGDIVTLVIGSDIMTVNGKTEQMDTAAIIRDDRTYIPVRFVAEAMGLEVEWTK